MNQSRPTVVLVVLAVVLMPRLSGFAQVDLGFAQLDQPPARNQSDPEQDVPQDAQLAETEQRLRAFLKSHDASADAQYELAYTLFRERKAKESLEEYTKAAVLRKPTAKDLQTVALDYVLLNDYEDADHWLSRSVQEQTQSMEAWYQLGRIKYTENRFAEAISCFEKALVLEPRSVKAENNLGLALEGVNRTEEAIQAYQQAIAWQQASAHPSEQPLINLAIVLINREQPQEALELLTQADRISPRYAKISEQLGRAYLKLGRLAEAQAAFEKAALLSPESAAIHFELGQVYRKQAKSQQAKEEFSRAAKLSEPGTGAKQP